MPRCCDEIRRRIHVVLVCTGLIGRCASTTFHLKSFILWIFSSFWGRIDKKLLNFTKSGRRGMCIRVIQQIEIFNYIDISYKSIGSFEFTTNRLYQFLLIFLRFWMTSVEKKLLIVFWNEWNEFSFNQWI